jgi:glycosyltransferase involved in cell wall biosynthesis
VNDGSRDRSWEVICDLASRHKSIRGVNLMRNYGQHNALLCGIRLATHDVVVTIDDDLQHPPDQIPKLLERLGDDCDVVYGTPLQERHGLLRDVASRITKMALQSAMGADTARSVSAFRALRTNLRDAFSEYRGPFVSVDTLLTWGTVRFAAVTVESAPRYSGQSNYTFRKLIVHAFNMMTGFSTIPLQFASWIGFAFTVVGVAVLAYVLIRYLIQGAAVPGFAFLASIIALFSGAQLFALGILGEYLARMHFRIMDRPPYVVRGKTHANLTATRADFDTAAEG